jgi:hypothetical protein
MHAMMLCYLTASADYIIEPNDKDSSGQEALYVAEYEFQQLYARSQAEFSSVPPYSFTYHLIYSEEKTQMYGYIAFSGILLMSLLPGVTGGGLPVTESQGDIRYAKRFGSS